MLNCYGAGWTYDVPRRQLNSLLITCCPRNLEGCSSLCHSALRNTSCPSLSQPSLSVTQHSHTSALEPRILQTSVGIDVGRACDHYPFQQQDYISTSGPRSTVPRPRRRTQCAKSPVGPHHILPPRRRHPRRRPTRRVGNG